MRRAPVLLLLALLTACAKPQPARPALWEVNGPGGEKGWLFGTIHQLPREADWRTPTVSRALDQADSLVLEIAAIDDDAKTAAAFTALAKSPNLPPLSRRIDPKLRSALDKVIAEDRLDPAALSALETWAAALTLASASSKDTSPDNGIDRALVRAFPDKTRLEFEGAQDQLAIFDRLPETDQRSLLEATLRDDPGEASEEQLAEAWRKGDMNVIARETRTGMLANPALRKALYLDRNLAWQAKLEAILRQGRRPFVAVGAAHMAGSDGLPALLAARGWKVMRIQ